MSQVSRWSSARWLWMFDGLDTQHMGLDTIGKLTNREMRKFPNGTMRNFLQQFFVYQLKTACEPGLQFASLSQGHGLDKRAHNYKVNK